MRFSRKAVLIAAACVLTAAGCHRHKYPALDKAVRSDAKATARAFLQAGKDDRWEVTAAMSRYTSLVVTDADRPWPGDGVGCPAEVANGWRGRAFHDWDGTVGDLVDLPVDPSKGSGLTLAPVGGAENSGRVILVALERGNDGAWVVCDLVRLEQGYVDQLSPEPAPELAARP